MNLHVEPRQVLRITGKVNLLIFWLSDSILCIQFASLYNQSPFDFFLFILLSIYQAWQVVLNYLSEVVSSTAFEMGTLLIFKER